SHHGILDIALGLRIPGMTVLTPSGVEDLRALLEVGVELPGPVMVPFPKGSVTTRADLDIAADDDVRGLAARRITRGADVCILAVGDRVAATLDAARMLADADVDAEVWDVRSVRPADPEMLAAAANAP